MRLAVLLLTAAMHTAIAQTISFPDFSNTKGLALTGSARRSKNLLRLTPAEETQRGAAWFKDRQFVSSGFETYFQFRLTAQDRLQYRGADGFAFVLQTTGTKALGAVGAAGGFAAGDALFETSGRGIPLSFAVFFDTYKNDPGGDPSDNFIVVCSNGRLKEMRWPPRWLAFQDLRRIRLKDGEVHSVTIRYDPPVFLVFLDDSASPILQSSIHLAAVTESDGTAYAGFTASTGGGYQNHDILSWTFRPGRPRVSSVTSNISFQRFPCLPDRPLCTPEQPLIDQPSPGIYHIVLPANREWSASIPNPNGAPVRIRNPSGTVCWDRPEGNFTGCNGPAGDGAWPRTRQTLALPAQLPGALVSRTQQGRTSFTVNAPAAAFDASNGFFEFDVELQLAR